MDNLLYYPGFEIKNENWLKFALLYIEDIKTIVPQSSKSSLSETYKKITNSTNLLSIINPDIDEGIKSSREMIERLEKIISNPERYTNEFINKEYLDLWEKNSLHTFELHNDKYSDEFKRYLESNNLCTNFNDGIKVTNDIGLLYMAKLAQNISSKYNLNTISDNQDYNRLKTIDDYLWKYNNCEVKSKISKSTIELIIPTDLESVSIDKIITLRNSKNYMKNLKSFHNVMNVLGEKKGMEDINAEDIKKQLEEITGSIKKDLTTGILKGFGKALISKFIDFDEAGDAFEVLGDMFKNMISQKIDEAPLESRIIMSDKKNTKAFITDLSGLDS